MIKYMKLHQLCCLLMALFFSCSKQEVSPRLEVLSSPASSLLQAISIVDESTVWMSGHEASFIRTKDGGVSWELYQHPTGDTLQFRDIHAFSEEKAILMSAGPGPLSRIFTFKAPDQWQENFVMLDSLGFLDCIDFWDDQRGIAYGDAIDSYPYILLTTDGGESWQRSDTTKMPKAGLGEGGFAASGTCVTTGANGRAWIATGAGGNARFLLTSDFGKSWEVVKSPIVKGDAAGHTSVSFEGNQGFAVGGDLLNTDGYTDNCLISNDGGASWQLTSPPETKGAFYGCSLAQVGEGYFAFSCGPNGLDYTGDLGKTWHTLDTLNYWAVSFDKQIGYACGTEGKILKISLH